MLLLLAIGSCKKEDTGLGNEIKTNCVNGISTTRKVLFIGVDGCRTDALLQAASPAFDSLMAHGYVNLHCDRGPYTVSCPGWSTLLYGVFPAKHGVTSNDIEGHSFGAYHDLFYYMRQSNPSYSLSVVSHWDNFLRLTTSEDYAVAVATDEEVKNKALYLLNSCVPDVLVLHFDDVDDAGHTYGFSPADTNYIGAIEQTGRYVTDIMNAVATREQTYNEEWMVVVVTDHGGSGTSHGDQDNLEETRYVFEIIRLPGLNRVEVTTASNTDIMPSMLKYMGIPIQPSWNLDGAPLF